MNLLKEVIMRSIYPLFVAALLFWTLSGCSVINFGIGAAIDGPSDLVQQNEYKAEPVHIPHFRVKYVRLHTVDGGVREFSGASAYFVQEKGKGFIGINPNGVEIRRKDGTSGTGFLGSYRRAKGDVSLELTDPQTYDSSQTIPVSDLARIRFYPFRADTLAAYSGDHLYEPMGNREIYTLDVADIEGFYLGFFRDEAGEEPFYVQVGEVEKVVYRQPMGMTPYLLAGVGLVADVIIGIILLLR